MNISGKIIKASLSDVPQLNVLVNSAYRGETSRKGWTTEADLIEGSRVDEQTLTGYLNNPAVTMLKYLDDHNIIKGCVYLELQEESMYLGMLTVAPEMQTAGIGKQLLNAAESFAREMNRSLIKMTVITTRHELLNWYERRGYKKTGEILPFHMDKKFGTPKQPIELALLQKNV